MLFSKSFYKATRRGNVVKVVREVYLRDDVCCGFANCKKCDPNENTKVLNTTSPILILDTNVILHQIDMLVNPSSLTNIVILQTVLEEVKNQSRFTYKRLRDDIISKPERNAYVFMNNLSRDTHVEREGSETPNDLNDRAIRVAASWFADHLKKSQVILLTNDKDNLQKALELGINAQTVHKYVKQLGQPLLIDLLKNSVDGDKKGEAIFPEHLAVSELQKKIHNNELYEGKLRMNASNYLEGTVKCEVKGESIEILIQGAENLNRGVEGDLVAVDLFPKSSWRLPSVLLMPLSEQQIGAENETVPDFSNTKKTEEGIPTGRIVGIIKRNWKPQCGSLVTPLTADSHIFTFIPSDRRFPRILIKTRQGLDLIGKRIIVAFDKWERHSNFPFGHFVKSLGDIGNKDTESEAILISHNILYHGFNNEVLKCLPVMPWTITKEDMIGRKDLRDIGIFSVDPPGCTDIDDALHIRRINEYEIEVGVHIADVSHFVREGTALDDEAFHRATTVYLVDRRIEMLPSELSSDLCSLKGNVERFAFSVVWRMTNDGQIISSEFHKSLIKSVGAFTYEQAQNRIDNLEMQDQISKDLRMMLALSKILKARRIEAGAIVLSSNEVKFKLDGIEGDPTDVEMYQLRETNSMIEEFMLLANIEVAKKIHRHYPGFALLRRHPAPLPHALDTLLSIVKKRGFELDPSSSKTLSLSLDKAEDPNDPFFNKLLRILTTRCMCQALYFSTGSQNYDQFYHYGLAAQIYTHFTSPIRRYADLVVHRLLAGCVGGANISMKISSRFVTNVCNHLNIRNRMAASAGRGSTELHTMIYLKDKVLEEEAYVIRVRANAFVVLIPRLGIEGNVFVCPPTATGDPIYATFSFDEKNQQLTKINDSKTKIKIFDKVKVQLSIETQEGGRQRLKTLCLEPYIAEISSTTLGIAEKPVDVDVDVGEEKIESTINLSSIQDVNKAKNNPKSKPESGKRKEQTPTQKSKKQKS